MEKKEFKINQAVEIRIPEGCFCYDCASCNDALDFKNPNLVKCARAGDWIKIPATCPYK